MHFTTFLSALLLATIPAALAAPAAEAAASPDRYEKPETTKSERVKLKINSKGIGSWKADITLGKWQSVAKDLHKPGGPFFEKVCMDNPGKAMREHITCIFDDGMGGVIKGAGQRVALVHNALRCTYLNRAVYAVKCCKEYCTSWD